MNFERATAHLNLEPAAPLPSVDKTLNLERAFAHLNLEPASPLRSFFFTFSSFPSFSPCFPHFSPKGGENRPFWPPHELVQASKVTREVLKSINSEFLIRGDASDLLYLAKLRNLFESHKSLKVEMISLNKF